MTYCWPSFRVHVLENGRSPHHLPSSPFIKDISSHQLHSQTSCAFLSAAQAAADPLQQNKHSNHSRSFFHCFSYRHVDLAIRQAADIHLVVYYQAYLSGLAVLLEKFYHLGVGIRVAYAAEEAPRRREGMEAGQANDRDLFDRDRGIGMNGGGRGHLYLHAEGEGSGRESDCGCMVAPRPAHGVPTATALEIPPEVVASEAEVAFEVVGEDET